HDRDARARALRRGRVPEPRPRARAPRQGEDVSPRAVPAPHREPRRAGRAPGGGRVQRARPRGAGHLPRARGGGDARAGGRGGRVMPGPVSRRAPLSEAAAASTGRRVLLVDDHPDIRAMLSLALAGAGVGDVLTASDGREALALIERDLQQVKEVGRRLMVDLIVLDIMMPGLSGFDVLRALRARFTELPPVLIISALDSQAHVQEAIELGAVE